MGGIWLISYVILWLLVIGAGLVILALAREVESLHKRLDSFHKYVLKMSYGPDGREKQEASEQAEGIHQV